MEQDCRISDAEWQVMRIVWTLGTASSSQIVAQLTAKFSWSPSTTKTLLRRLEKKGFLQVDRLGHRFSYRAALGETEAMHQSLQADFANMCDMRKGEMILRLLDELPLSRKDLEAIALKAGQKAKTAPEKVDCNCLSSCQQEEGGQKC
ncbi:uracil phosphoribosyltransferase [Lactobacillus nasalidis]|uniref:Uracil phosphoribosyltransferase n=1 Tax=Lactobacillus nasalidis TaxID=2797258 RepID=A0ABQ3W5K2_9LACO|nr:CopY/TcrY family copper transport repressor [Lactobacillus nasalidis]GHV97212.1 uracil phosphoribosyltransferase [Lactobacillus nasalidis]GHW00149.1 uracil phosphoribosyltransferase [Lactobacillus nasalidis]GHW00369.1 uracil phosphoribosyltransferase [Lactobacillus nasalidis]